MAKKQINQKKPKEFKFTRKPIFNIHHQADPLFAAKCHPSEPVFITGTATGHVQAYRYDIDKLLEIYEDQDKFPYDVSCVKYDDFDDDSIVSQWHTKRHKKSCRDLCFDLPSGGEKVHTLGSEGVIKTADVKTGQVINKFVSSKDNVFENNSFDVGTYTRCVSTPGKNFLLVGDENGNLMCHDTRSKHLKLCYKPFKKLHLGEGINSINYCWPKSDYKIITTGSTTVCELDLRKPEEPLHTSEDQEDEILCSSWLDQEKQEVMICGMGDVVTTWKPNMNKWNDQISRIRVAKGETVESLISAMDSDSRFMYGGCSNGHIAKIDIVGGKVVERFLQHDPEEDDKVDEVLGLDLDCNYRLVSFGTDGFKIWEDEAQIESGDEDDEESEDESSDNGEGFETGDSGSESDEEKDETIGILANADEEEEDEEEEEEEAEEEEQEKTPVKRSLSESLKRRMGSSNSTQTKKPKVEEQNADNSNVLDSDVGEEVSDSDDDVDIEKVSAKPVELHTIRDLLLARVDNPELGIQEKPGKKKKQKPLKKLKPQHQEHGIRKFDGL